MKEQLQLTQAKERFFAQHLGQEVVFTKGNYVNRIGSKRKLDVTSLAFLVGGFKIKTALLLTSLSDITDEDKRDIAKMRFTFVGENFAQVADKYLSKSILPHDMHQCLQSKGYALDYYCPELKRVITVPEQIELGWIKLKEVNQQ